TAQTPGAPPPAAPPPLFATTKIADNVYVFRYGGYQSMFVVTPEGVIATDPIAYLRPQAAQTYIDEIRKITRAPIKYLVYSHHHYDHIAGGKPFKDAGASVIAHKNARAKLEALKYPDVVLPDMVVDQHSTIELGGTRVDLIYVGRNHSDNSLVMLLPKEKILFAVDFIPVQAVMFRDMPDGFLPDWFDSLDRVLALDFTTLIPGHPGPGGRIGTMHRTAAELDGWWRVVAGVFSSDPARSRAAGPTLGIDAARSYGDVAEMLDREARRDDRIDAVAIMTPNDTHYAHAVRALDA